jgi:hypothetical protein
MPMLALGPKVQRRAMKDSHPKSAKAPNNRQNSHMYKNFLFDRNSVLSVTFPPGLIRITKPRLRNRVSQVSEISKTQPLVY